MGSFFGISIFGILVIIEYLRLVQVSEREAGRSPASSILDVRAGENTVCNIAQRNRPVNNGRGWSRPRVSSAARRAGLADAAPPGRWFAQGPAPPGRRVPDTAKALDFATRIDNMTEHIVRILPFSGV
jgi:hypothetical protein